MDRWMDGWMYGWMDGLMNLWIGGWRDCCMNGYRWIDGAMGGHYLRYGNGRKTYCLTG